MRPILQHTGSTITLGLCPLLLLLLSTPGCRPTSSPPLRIATAANAQFAMKALIDTFTLQYKIPCQMIIGSSGKLTAQIREGAPFDLFISADMKYPSELYKAGFAKKAPQVYAYGSLVIWSMNDRWNIQKKDIHKSQTDPPTAANSTTPPTNSTPTKNNSLLEIDIPSIQSDSLSINAPVYPASDSSSNMQAAATRADSFLAEIPSSSISNPSAETILMSTRSDSFLAEIPSSPISNPSTETIPAATTEGSFLAEIPLESKSDSSSKLTSFQINPNPISKIDTHSTSADSLQFLLQPLLDPSIKHIAMANPLFAPYGIAAKQALQNAGIFHEIEPKLVFGESISQTNQFILSQTADIGFTASSVVLAPTLFHKGYWFELPPECYSPIQQGALLLHHDSQDSSLTEQAQIFYRFLFSPTAKRILQTYGYTIHQQSLP